VLKESKIISDIEQIVVKTVNGLPIYVKNVAEVRFKYCQSFAPLQVTGKVKSTWASDDA
jgi:cobalt-zinc-cadmium resistance protein CzcA